MQHFTRTTLNENWYEERLAQDQMHKVRPDIKLLRDKEPDISTLSATGVPAPLRAFHRKPKQETKSLICDDNFREMQTTNQEQLKNPRVHVNKQKPILSMIHKYNIAELSLVDRPIESQKAGFGAKIPQHSAGHDRRYFQTENRDFYGESAKMSSKQDVEKINLTKTGAGANNRPIDEQCTKIISNLTGEIFDSNHDAQLKTDVQRTWLYQIDPAVAVVKDGNARQQQVNMFDNATSLPMGDGMHKVSDHMNHTSAYGRKKCDVTHIRNNAITRK